MLNWYKARNKSTSSPKEMYSDNNQIHSWSESNANHSKYPLRIKASHYKMTFLVPISCCGILHFSKKCFRNLISCNRVRERKVFSFASGSASCLFSWIQISERIDCIPTVWAYYTEHTVHEDPKKINAKRDSSLEEHPLNTEENYINIPVTVHIKHQFSDKKEQYYHIQVFTS